MCATYDVWDHYASRPEKVKKRDRDVSCWPDPDPTRLVRPGSGCWGTPAACEQAGDVIGGSECDPLRKSQPK